MSGSRITPRVRWLTLSLAVAFVLGLFSPAAVAMASTGLTSGDEAVIVNTGGDLIRLRSKPGLHGTVVGEYPEDTAVSVIDGPQISDDGAAWYRVAIDGQSGYMAAEFLAPAGATPEEEPGAAADPVPNGDGEAVVSAEVIGTATVVNTGGDPIRCRAEANAGAEILAHVYESDSVELTGEPDGDWQPVLCDGQNGWVHTDYLTTGGVEPDPEAAPTPEFEEELDEAFVTLASVATIANTGGSGVNCRSRPSTGSNVVAVLAEGDSISLRGTARNGWFPVTCEGRRGYVWAEYVSTDGSSGESSGDDVTGTGVIGNTGGDGVRCRKKASFDGAILMVLTEGDGVQLRGAQRGEWQPVFCGGKKGYVHADYVEIGGSSGGGSSSGWQSGDTAEVTGTNGQGVRLRSSASTAASVISVLSEGTRVDVRSGSTGDWVAVSYRGSSGFVHGDYLTEVSGGGNPGGGSSGELSDGDHARVTESLNFRSGPNTSSGVIGIAPEGLVVEINGARQNGFYPVSWGSQAGFMHGDYLTWTDEPLSPWSDGTGGGNAGSGSPSAVGRAMVDYAMEYLGYPYVWATAGPDSFDCSGFTYWVTKHVIGDDIGRGLWTQVVAGTPVSYGNLKPGDLVFFQNTYTWGLSHVGIYIGNNQFIHAENEESGVRISSITSTYYSTRYYGAVRLG